MTLALLCLLPGVRALAADGPEWLDGWTFKGDMRLRYEGIQYDKDDMKTRNRGRFRLRLAAKKKIMDALSFEMRFATGGDSAVSTNQTFDDSFNGKGIYIDRAFLKYDYKDWSFSGGKLKNPFHTTDIVWDTDVNPEGLSQHYNNGAFYATFGEMLIEEESSSQDTNLIAAQVGSKKKDFYDVSVGLYSYQGLDYFGEEIDYQFLEGVGGVNLGPGVLTLTYIKNTTSDIEDEDTAYAAYYEISSGAFTYNLKYGHVELNSSLNRFTDGDFGGNDKEGFFAGCTYNASKFVSWKLSVFSVDSIVAEDLGFTTVQLDLILKL